MAKQEELLDAILDYLSTIASEAENQTRFLGKIHDELVKIKRTLK